MIKWLVKRIVLSLIKNDEEFCREITKRVNPDRYYEIEYGNMIHKPPPFPEAGTSNPVNGNKYAL